MTGKKTYKHIFHCCEELLLFVHQSKVHNTPTCSGGRRLFFLDWDFCKWNSASEFLLSDLLSQNFAQEKAAFKVNVNL